MAKPNRDDEFPPIRSRGSIWPIIAILVIVAGFIAAAYYIDIGDSTGMGFGGAGDLDLDSFLAPAPAAD